jgi:hypothetical protein
MMERGRWCQNDVSSQQPAHTYTSAWKDSCERASEKHNTQIEQGRDFRPKALGGEGKVCEGLETCASSQSTMHSEVESSRTSGDLSSKPAIQALVASCTTTSAPIACGIMLEASHVSPRITTLESCKEFESAKKVSMHWVPVRHRSVPATQTRLSFS